MWNAWARRHLLADVAEPDDTKHLVLELVEHDRRQIVAAPPPGDDIFMLPNQSPRDRINSSACSATETAFEPPLLQIGSP
jgi:hypothetical protein